MGIKNFIEGLGGFFWALRCEFEGALDRRAPIGSVIMSVTGDEPLPKVMSVEQREEILKALEKAGYKDPEFSLKAYQFCPPLESFLEKEQVNNNDPRP